ncbi:MAG TPA: 30S ribosomal protein S17 [Candidatus Moranbacteria bacterium]|nr:30S ribosomal protein S17 [Candidatus Moranbacteria bacterium]
MPEDKKKVIIKKKGIVVSDKMTKTVVVAVDSLKTHPKYKKKYISTKKYKAHDAEGKYKTGDEVEIVPCKPMSKDKCYKVI